MKRKLDKKQEAKKRIGSRNSNAEARAFRNRRSRHGVKQALHQYDLETDEGLEAYESKATDYTLRADRDFQWFDRRDRWPDRGVSSWIRHSKPSAAGLKGDLGYHLAYAIDNLNRGNDESLNRWRERKLAIQEEQRKLRRENIRHLKTVFKLGLDKQFRLYLHRKNMEAGYCLTKPEITIAPGERIDQYYDRILECIVIEINYSPFGYNRVVYSRAWGRGRHDLFAEFLAKFFEKNPTAKLALDEYRERKVMR